MNNIVDRLQTFNQERDPQLIQLKYRAMRTDVFAFYRGTCHLFYEDWHARSSLDEVPPVWICGDLHWQNLGSYKGDNRLVYFDINDFDEAVLAPCTWDLARFLVSLWVSTRILNMNKSKASTLCTYFLDVYTRTLGKGYVRSVEEDKTAGLVRELLFQVKVRSRKDLLDGRTEQTGAVRKLRIDGKHATPVIEAERVEVTNLLEYWGAKQTNPRFYTVLDIAHRVAGIGSLGVERYILLVEGKGSPNRNYLLDLKAESSSSLQPYLTLPQPSWINEAERTVTIQRWFQNVPPALLAAVEMDGKCYVLRELQPEGDKVNVEFLGGKLRRLERLVKTIAQVIAWGQLRSCGRQGSTPAYDLMNFAQKSQWHNTLLKYAQEYAAQVEDDYRAFCSAYDGAAFSSGQEAPYTSSTSLRSGRSTKR